ncbi:MAG TPA: hypothetical protein VNH64_03120 [Parvularculaceae bacterium]|nr:hypothetical protein [Parvularculaceae bacterium]
MRFSASLVISTLIMALSSCASADSGSSNHRRPETPTVRQFALSAITESNVPQGDCGMVLWTLDEAQPMPIFRYLVGKGGEISVGGALVALTLSETSGASAFGVSEHQVLTSTVGLKVTVEVSFSTGFDGGSYLRQGVVRVEAPDGWRIVAPSAGVAGCRAK